MTTTFARFRPVLERLPAGTDRHPDLLLGREGKYSVYYTPFEHVNPAARLVIVGITPGPGQMALAHQAVQSGRGLDEASALARAKRSGAFGGKTVRPNLVRMLEHFHIPELLALKRAEDLWCDGWHLFQPTSVVPNAAFEMKGGQEKPFAGSFADILRSPLLKAQFEERFLWTVGQVCADALWVGLGPTPCDALDWVVERGLLKPEQIVHLAHPSSNSGSQVACFLGERDEASLNPRDPVHKRLTWQKQAYARTAENLKRRRLASNQAPAFNTAQSGSAPTSRGA